MCVSVCVIANEDVHMLIQGCQLWQVSLARDRASWAVSCPGFGQASPGQGQAAVGAAVASLARLGLASPGFGCPGPMEAPWSPHGSGSGGEQGLGCCSGVPGPHPPSRGSRDAGGMGTGRMLPPPPCDFFPLLDLTQNLPLCEMAAGE